MVEFKENSFNYSLARGEWKLEIQRRLGGVMACWRLFSVELTIVDV